MKQNVNDGFNGTNPETIFDNLITVRLKTSGDRKSSLWHMCVVFFSKNVKHAANIAVTVMISISYSVATA